MKMDAMERLPQCLALAVLTASLLSPFPVSASNGSRAMVGVSARVLTFFRVGPVSHPPVIELEDRHIRQGYVDFEGASSVLVSSNAAAPISVRIGYDENIVDRVSVRMMDTEILAEAPGGSGLVPYRVRGQQEVRVNYRLYLRRGIGPGTRAWPVDLSLTPTI